MNTSSCLRLLRRNIAAAPKRNFTTTPRNNAYKSVEEAKSRYRSGVSLPRYSRALRIFIHTPGSSWRTLRSLPSHSESSLDPPEPIRRYSTSSLITSAPTFTDEIFFVAVLMARRSAFRRSRSRTCILLPVREGTYGEKEDHGDVEGCWKAEGWRTFDWIGGPQWKGGR
jgi:hypothetical protein